LQGDGIQQHSHFVGSGITADPTGDPNIYTDLSDNNDITSYGNNSKSRLAIQITSTGAASKPLAATSITSGNVDSETRPKNVAVNYCIVTD